jgi:hypothetical protein
MSELKELSCSFDAWLAGAQPGSRVIYHTGPTAAGKVCREAMAASEGGKVVLMQKRSLKAGHFHYIAQRATERRSK